MHTTPPDVCSYWSDPVVLEKMSKVMGDVFHKDEAQAGLAGESAEGEEAEEEEAITLHNCARDGGPSAPTIACGLFTRATTPLQHWGHLGLCCCQGLHVVGTALMSRKAAGHP